MRVIDQNAQGRGGILRLDAADDFNFDVVARNVLRFSRVGLRQIDGELGGGGRDLRRYRRKNSNPGQRRDEERARF